MTSFSDIDASRVIFVAETRRKEVVSEFTKDMKQRGYDPERIDLICCDMWDAYLNGIRNHIPQASVVFDRFHIMKQMNKAIEKVRWAEQKTNKDLKKTRFIWLKNPKNLTEKQAEQLIELKKLDLKTARAYQIKLALQFACSLSAFLFALSTAVAASVSILAVHSHAASLAVHSHAASHLVKDLFLLIR